jgi:ribosome recycling factor
MPLNQVSSITVRDARTLAISPWDKGLIPHIEKAIMQANLGLNPATAGTTIIIPLPALTGERRVEMIKLVKSTTENFKVTLRTIRRDSNEEIKKLLKDKSITEDEEHKTQDRVQKLTDEFIAEMDKAEAAKEKELSEV